MTTVISFGIFGSYVKVSSGKTRLSDIETIIIIINFFAVQK